ncbi:MAG: sodium:solute symporter family protein [Planctomycetes bacterium]|nr:sodium:solute symporter family protein [Planctomycetota bacterium]MBL7143773.1 sodium:solute symporter family protein [Phycisphaerae bacterium]
MEFLGLHYAIWIVLVLYFAGMLLMGWWSKKGIHNQEGYLLGNRQFGWPMMVMHAFGAGTHPGNVAGVMSQGVVSGASGIWVSWMWLFGTPFYWIIAPIIRRMRCLTMADFFRERFGRSASVLYIIVASVGMIVFLAGVMLATTRTVQGVMGKATVQESDMWFFGILFVTTVVFIIYSYWGGIIAAIRTDMIQGFMIIALSFIAIPIALSRVDGLVGMRATLAAQENTYLSLFDPKQFSLLTVLLLSINAPLTALAFPHLMSVCAAGKTEWEGRIGFTYGNILKRVCTIGWCVLGLCWLAYLLNTGSEINKDAAFGDAIRGLLSPGLQGIMLACVMAAAMSSGDAVQVTVAGLFSQNIYRVFINPNAEEKQLVHVTRIIGVFIAFSALVAAILMRSNLVKAILDYFNILSLVGISTAMGILWPRMNATGMFSSTILASGTFLISRYVLNSGRDVTIGIPILVGVLAGVIGSLVTKPPSRETIEKFFTKIYVPIGQEDKLALPLDEAVPRQKRLLPGSGLFIVKPSRQSWIGLLVTLGICLACVLVMLVILK